MPQYCGLPVHKNRRWGTKIELFAEVKSIFHFPKKASRYDVRIGGRGGHGEAKSAMEVA